MQDIVVKISDEYLENGKTDNDTVNEMFELAYIRSTAAGQKIYQKYKGVLEYLTKQPMAIDNTTADILSENEVRRIMILSGDFLHISDDGLSVNEVYKKVKPMAPELFKGKLSAHEQLLRIYDAANALNSLRASLALRYSDDAEDNKNILKHEFRAAVDAGLPSLKDIRRFAESRKRQREGRDLERQAQREAVDDVWSYFVNPKANISRNSKNVNNGSAARNAAILCCQELSVK